MLLVLELTKIAQGGWSRFWSPNTVQQGPAGMSVLGFLFRTHSVPSQRFETRDLACQFVVGFDLTDED